MSKKQKKTTTSQFDAIMNVHKKILENENADENAIKRAKSEIERIQKLIDAEQNKVSEEPVKEVIETEQQDENDGQE